MKFKINLYRKNSFNIDNFLLDYHNMDKYGHSCVIGLPIRDSIETGKLRKQKCRIKKKRK